MHHLVKFDVIAAGLHVNVNECLCECVIRSVTSDDILAKYRKQPTAASKQSADTNVTPGPGSTSAAADAVARSKDKVVDDETPMYDSNNLEMCQAFLDAKKKLRLILSSVDLQVLVIFYSFI